MPFRLLVTQVKSPDPPFQGVVVSRFQFQVCRLQVGEQVHVVNSDCRLPGEGGEEVQPIRRRLKWTSMEHFQHTLDLSLRHQGCRVIRDESFFRKQLRSRKRSPRLGQVLGRHHAPFQGRPAGKTLAQPQTRPLNLV